MHMLGKHIARVCILNMDSCITVVVTKLNEGGIDFKCHLL